MSASRARSTAAAHRLRAVVLALVLVGLYAAALGDSRARVTAVLDGDTIRIERDGRAQTVRLIGVDTPELGDRKRPDAPPQPFAREAADFARRTLAERTVRLEFERGERRDHYGRLLAYVFLDDGTFFNRELVQQGYGRAYTRYPFRFAKQFRAAQEEARAAQRGLWAVHQTAAAAPGPIIGNRRSRIYHRPGQEHYNDVAVSNRVYFKTERDAVDAGYEPARR